MTDLSRLAPPQELSEVLKRRSRDHVILQQVRVDLGWWNAALEDRGLQGRVHGVDESGSHRADEGYASISRRQLFEQADRAAESPESALQLLWQSLAWGAGTSARNMHRRLDSVKARPDEVAEELVRVAGESRKDAAAAYEALRPGGRTLIKYLGPAFFTKFLYFAGQGNADHPCLILDARVAQSLHRHGWDSLRSGGGWPAATYERYTDLLHRWAGDLSTSDRTVAADEIELWLFEDAVK